MGENTRNTDNSWGVDSQSSSYFRRMDSRTSTSWRRRGLKSVPRYDLDWLIQRAFISTWVDTIFQSEICVSWNLCELKSVWAEICVSWNLCELKYVWAEICVSWNLCELKSVWAEICVSWNVWAEICVSWNLCELKSVWAEICMSWNLCELKSVWAEICVSWNLCELKSVWAEICASWNLCFETGYQIYSSTSTSWRRRGPKMVPRSNLELDLLILRAF